MSILPKPIRSLTLPARESLIVLLSVLLLRSRILTAPKDALSKLKLVARGNRLTAAELSEALQQLYVKENDGSKTLLVPYRDLYLSKVSTRHFYELTA